MGQDHLTWRQCSSELSWHEYKVLLLWRWSWTQVSLPNNIIMNALSQSNQWNVHGHWFFFSRLFFFFFRGNKNVSLYLSWNVIPNAGVLPLISQPNKFFFDFPNEYTVNRGGFDHWCFCQSQSLENAHL